MNDLDEQSNNPKQPTEYESKFADFMGTIERAKSENVPYIIVAWPSVLGDTYQEIVESLSRLAEAGLALHIVGRYAHGTMSKPDHFQ